MRKYMSIELVAVVAYMLLSLWFVVGEPLHNGYLANRYEESGYDVQYTNEHAVSLDVDSENKVVVVVGESTLSFVLRVCFAVWLVVYFVVGFCAVVPW